MPNNANENNRKKNPAPAQKSDKKEIKVSKGKMIAVICIALLVVGVIVVAVVMGTKPKEQPQSSAPVEVADDIVLNETRYRYVVMDFADYGGILLELDTVNAPLTVENFVSLVERGFYDGLTIHRIQENFVVQGGQSLKESVSPIKGEFYVNGVLNTISHKKGVISMARTTEYDSATSQFFICLSDTYCPPSLDGQYAGFGRIIAGLEKIDQMVKDYASYGKGNSMGFITDTSHQPVITSVKVITMEEARQIIENPESLNH